LPEFNTGFTTPSSVSVNSSTGECWATDNGSSQVARLKVKSDNTTERDNFTGFTSALSVATSSP